MTGNKKRSGIKKWLIAAVILLLAAVAVLWYLFTEKFDDTKTVKADYTVEAGAFMQEFKKDIRQANAKYTEKIIVVSGVISAIEMADTTANIKINDSLSGSYIIFTFQDQHLAEARALKAGDRVSIKGSCSGGNYSEILESEKIEFKRCTLTK